MNIHFEQFAKNTLKYLKKKLSQSFQLQGEKYAQIRIYFL